MIDINDAWYRISIKGIIYNKEWKILLCKGEHWVWDLPGWWLEHWEVPEEWLKREIKEEMWFKAIEVLQAPLCFIIADKWLSKTRPWIWNLCYEVKLNDLNFMLLMNV